MRACVTYHVCLRNGNPRRIASVCHYAPLQTAASRYRRCGTSAFRGGVRGATARPVTRGHRFRRHRTRRTMAEGLGAGGGVGVVVLHHRGGQQHKVVVAAQHNAKVVAEQRGA